MYSSMAVSARIFAISRFIDLPSRNPLLHSKPPPPRSLLLPFLKRCRLLSTSTPIVGCLISGVDGGGISDEFVSTQNSGFDRGFAVITNMLKRIEPLDTSVISKGVSESAKDSMKQTISTMLGLLPSDQFSVTVQLSRHPLDRLLISSIMTGYTLWNAEYRMSLMRNLDIARYSSSCSDSPKEEVLEESGGGDGNMEVGFDERVDDWPGNSTRVFGDLTLEAANYIQRLQSELSSAKEVLNVQKQETMQMDRDRASRNDLLEYLRSLEPDMVAELSRPSSIEVEDIIRQLVNNILQGLFKDESNLQFRVGSTKDSPNIHLNNADEFCSQVTTNRDYLAKLLFWCMLLGHHLRGLENRLHISCVVGLL